MDRVELLLAQLHAASMLLENLEDSQAELLEDLREAMKEATVCAYRLRLGRSFEKLEHAG